MISMDVFLPLMLPYAPGIALPAAYNALRQAAIEFCERTRLWRYEDSFDITAEECDEIAVPYGAELFEIERVRFNGAGLTPKSIGWLDEHIPRWRDDETSAAPQYVTQKDMGTIALYPRAAGHVDVAVWLRPAEDATELPDFLGAHYRKDIANGALAHALVTPNQPFTDPNMAMFYGQTFQAKLDTLFNKSIKGQQRAPTRTRSSFF